MSDELHRPMCGCDELPCPRCGLDFGGWADANRIETMERQLARYASALMRIASLSEGIVVNGSFDEPHSANTAREALAAEWIGPCVHGRDPWDRCDEPECMDEVEAWAAATNKARGGA